MNIALFISLLILAAAVDVSHQQGDGSTTMEDTLHRVMRAADDHCQDTTTGMLKFNKTTGMLYFSIVKLLVWYT